MALKIIEKTKNILPKNIIGIDLGTTNSLVSYVEKGVVKILKIDDSFLVPSIVAYTNNNIFVGKKAKELALTAPKLALSSIKRLMGKSLNDVKHHFPYNFYGKDSKTGVCQVCVGNHIVSPIDVSAQILLFLKKKCEISLNRKVKEIVLSVPAYFDEVSREATRQAAQIAGLQVIRLINEPTAAALNYESEYKDQGVYLVYDLGGGTFDVTLLKFQQGLFQVIATGGDAFCGGDDLDKLLFGAFLKHKDLLVKNLSIKEYTTYLNLMKQHKEGVTSSGFDFSSVEQEKLFRPFFEKTYQICCKVLEDGGYTFKNIQGMILVGGSTRLQSLKKFLKKVCLCPILDRIDPDLAVAKGAGLQASALMGYRNHLLLDVVSLSLGIETMGGIMEVMIPRNSPIPISKEQEYTTFKDNQNGMKIHVVQGERELIKNCRSLAMFELKGIPPMKAGLARIKVKFIIDTDGLLSVQAYEVKTGIKQEIQVKPTYGLTEEELKTKIDESYKFAKEDITSRLLISTQVEAQRMVTYLKQAIIDDNDLLLPKELSSINNLIDALENSVKQGSRDLILSIMDKLEDLTHSFSQKRVERRLCSSFQGIKTNNR